MKSLLLIVVLLGAHSVQAQPLAIEQDAFRLAQEINAQSPYLSPQQRARVAEHFQSIRQELYGTSAPVTNYVCVPRDNDSKPPYVFGVRSGINVNRISSSVFQTLQDCQSSLNGSRFIPDGSLLCISKDNDGRSPWQAAKITDRGTLQRIQDTFTEDLTQCQTLVRRAIIPYGSRHATLCTSRDHDTRAPYVVGSLDLSTASTTLGRESFDDLEACWNFIGATR